MRTSEPRREVQTREQQLEQTCAACGRNLGPNFRFRFATGPRDSVVKCVRCAPRHGAVVRKAFWTAVIVGTILTIINQGDALLTVVLTGQAAPELLWKIPLTYCVPYAVSSYSALAISRV